ncbi:MAG: ATP-binding cassette domain-containing protein [Candidatus Limnocylindrus sp.]|jgi:ABC-2 type transport system ATP-binding protein
MVSPAQHELAARSSAAVEARGIGRVFQAKGGPVTALQGIDLRIEPGELFGVLGPNGAGKSTLIKILSTLLLPTSGTASIFGLDVATETERVRRIMNIVAGGDFSGYGLLTVREQLAMFAQFYGMPYREGMRRVDGQLEAFGIADIGDRKISALSTGQRQKLNFARSFLNDPWMLFLDEPTIGLDVSAARDVRSRIRAFQAEVPGRTVLLTTHYMAEADELCDRIAIVDHGRILAQGTPAELKRMVQREALFIVGLDEIPPSTPLDALRRLPGVVSIAVRDAAESGHDISGVASPMVRLAIGLRDDASLAGVITALAGAGAHLREITKSEPTLEEVFVQLVGRGIAESDAEARQ